MIRPPSPPVARDATGGHASYEVDTLPLRIEGTSALDAHLTRRYFGRVSGELIGTSSQSSNFAARISWTRSLAEPTMTRNALTLSNLGHGASSQATTIHMASLRGKKVTTLRRKGALPSQSGLSSIALVCLYQAGPHLS
jgi:hypothetical protein